MKHFTQVNDDNEVINVIVIADSVLLDENGVEREELGADFCKSFGEGRWIQTSKESKFRRLYAGIGDLYREDTDAFLHRCPYRSWTFSDATWLWEPPVPKPASAGLWGWDEETTSWVEYEQDPELIENNGSEDPTA